MAPPLSTSGRFIVDAQAVTFFAAWQDVAARYRSNPLVAGMDIMNEPRTGPRVS